jgi:hypothetical protein
MPSEDVRCNSCAIMEEECRGHGVREVRGTVLEETVLRDG